MDFPNLNLLVYWITEREAVRKRRADGDPPPWSDDRIFQRKFCNVERERDAVSVWIREHWRDPTATIRTSGSSWWPRASAATIRGYLPRSRRRCRGIAIATSPRWRLKGSRSACADIEPGLALRACRTHEHLARTSSTCCGPRATRYARRPATPARPSTRACAPSMASARFSPHRSSPTEIHAAPVRRAGLVDLRRPRAGQKRGLNVVVGRDPEYALVGGGMACDLQELEHRDRAASGRAGLRLSSSDVQSGLCELSKWHLAKTTGRIPPTELYRPPGAAPRKRQAKPPTPAPSIEPLAPVPRALPELAAARDPAAAHVLFRDAGVTLGGRPQEVRRLALCVRPVDGCAVPRLRRRRRAGATVDPRRSGAGRVHRGRQQPELAPGRA